MALHDELAELRAEVGPQVFDDPVAFRAAFDDFIPEGSASTGEVSLLVGAIATGALQRLKEQLALGADPDMTIAVQGDLLARDRGTTETSGARWALSVLAHAIGAVPVDKVLTRPTPGPDSIGTAARPTGAPDAPATPASVDTGPTRPIAGTPPEPSGPAPDATRVVSEAPPGGPPDEPHRPAGRGRNPLLIGAAVVLAVVVVTALVILLLLRDDSPNETAEDSSSNGPSDEEVLAEVEMSEAGKTVQVQLVTDGTDTSVVLLAEQDGEFVEVDREAATCPFLAETSYDAAVQDQGNRQIYVTWQDEETAGWGEYGEVQIDEDKLILFGVDDVPCPEAP
ncbi:hypothetical protein [Nocardioides bizhenqiangii]|uniref:Uncharacterized protein n=1 Tax=Nocardioides bizhenqiangii TaxID=3095076 RepID=A0ABZ0ZNA9_9ACTN|nr:MULTISPECIES: hypothetical protein [unclassified Nocardioides]MDZ5621347.1 hypothetical protein [Nocardioides sp. HM23]WQQ25812.1 hypothetical protein SHK19_17820 [Nocardioides sp. HM61]